MNTNDSINNHNNKIDDDHNQLVKEDAPPSDLMNSLAVLQ